VESAFSFRRFGYALGAMVGVLLFGTIAFHATLRESWLQSFYRAVVSSSLTGLDTVPPNDSARILTIILVLGGITIFAYIGTLLVEVIARGVIGGTLAERRRRKAIEALRDHYIICGFGRVGRRVARSSGTKGHPSSCSISASRPRKPPTRKGCSSSKATARTTTICGRPGSSAHAV